MAKETGIAWTTHSWNPWIGCTEVSPGCDNCYARALDKRHRYGGALHWGVGVPRYLTKSWEQPLAWNRAALKSGKRATVFPSMCDPFDKGVDPEWRRRFGELIYETPALTWLLLTKRIGNAAAMMYADPGPGCRPLKNVWVGASVVNQEEADRDLPKLLRTPAALRFVSYEPALGPIDFSRYFEQYPDHNGVRVVQNGNGVDWIIVGGESSQGTVKARPFALSWAYSTVAQCRDAAIPVFVKQLGSTIQAENSARGIDMFAPKFRDRAGADPAEWPADLRIQELPR